nr:MAG TPA: hypothetical protein [Caudoviricetes sp.]
MNTINLCQAGISFLAFGGVGRFLNPTPLKERKFLFCIQQNTMEVCRIPTTLYMLPLFWLFVNNFFIFF